MVIYFMIYLSSQAWLIRPAEPDKCSVIYFYTDKPRDNSVTHTYLSTNFLSGRAGGVWGYGDS